ncbi:Uncharacterised protein [Mycobacteroides abscessus subsp. massiliense]|uniref:hypothetical protein n=1 Tax=Mycobacteroides abscessus TaxID=36809 RepID=UPI0009A62011|nr:hypothetical protein [Mycobacteroides abscessus]SKM80598.1 Uncharacterised protein [Mycobacteroides abscessus subsp. massiliense]SKM96888.1 Uncharacterised protein [Mycobacteroides abscessus subsp. massiliense]SKN75894.1 Uncharacterised protein [Mycobacteroides abscessus subsp. massiliense]SKN97351.1 Uncharacterised protein [Mycobacteroides abscessus subsp. massiliense]SKO20519.1 Uncharacterised protein [Mycobacteroides abscessus subsp. massiliense]
MAGDKEVLKVDLDALGKLGPHLRTLEEQITASTAACSTTAPAGADPGLAALYGMSKAIVDVKKVAAARLGTIADFADEAQKDFAVTSSSLEAGFRNLPSIYKPPLQA